MINDLVLVTGDFTVLDGFQVSAEELPSVTHSKKAMMCLLEEVHVSILFCKRDKLLVKVNFMCLDNNM